MMSHFTYLLSHPFRARRTHKAVIAPPPLPIGIKWRLDLRLIISFHKKQTITETDASSWWALKYFDYLCVCFQLYIIFFSNFANCIKKHVLNLHLILVHIWMSVVPSLFMFVYIPWRELTTSYMDSLVILFSDLWYWKTWKNSFLWHAYNRSHQIHVFSARYRNRQMLSTPLYRYVKEKY